MQVRREIHARDGGQCTFVSADGRRCNARAFIQVDHVEPFARDGSSDTLNLRLLCESHNLLHARKCFGNEHIAAKVAARSRSNSGPRLRREGVEIDADRLAAARAVDLDAFGDAAGERLLLERAK